jgi:hypothetical protein
VYGVRIVAVYQGENDTLYPISISQLSGIAPEILKQINDVIRKRHLDADGSIDEDTNLEEYQLLVSKAEVDENGNASMRIARLSDQQTLAVVALSINVL